jgi:DNA-binding LacI/PurR family transcriptional regulator
MSSRPTIIDVAERAGVSKSTVSRVLQGAGERVSPETQALVWKAIRDLGYERNAVASSLRTERTFMMMLVTPDITNPFWPEVARGLQDTVEPANYSVVLANSDWDVEREKQFLQTLRRNRFDALVINPTAVSNQDLLALRIPTVVLGLGNEFPDLDVVGSDSYHGTLEAFNYLYVLGHRRIGFIWGQHRAGWAQTRLNGYLDFLRQHGLPHDEGLVVEAPFELAGGHWAMRQLLALAERPTAVFASNDILAVGALQAARETGLAIPGELSIIGMDDIYAAALTTPPLTTMAKSKYETGRWAAQFALERVEGHAPPTGRRQALPCRLVVRGTTAPPAN